VYQTARSAPAAHKAANECLKGADRAGLFIGERVQPKRLRPERGPHDEARQ
jgi:hypothetical protein